MSCRFCDCIPCMCGKHDYPNTVCRMCGYSSGCVCGLEDYEDKEVLEYDPICDPYSGGID